MRSSNIVRHVLSGLATITTLAVTQVAAAASVASTKLHRDGWIYNAVLDDSNGDGQFEVIALLALADSAVIGDNINAIWYVRAGDEWDRKAWLTQNPWEAVNELKMTYGIGDEQDVRWMMPDTAEPTTTIGFAMSFDGVVLSDDPLAPLLAAHQNDGSIAIALVEFGYMAAANSLEFTPAPGVECEAFLVLEGMASMVQAAEAAPPPQKINAARIAWEQIASCEPPDIIVPGDSEFPLTPVQFTCTPYPSPIQPSDLNKICYTWTEVFVQLESRVVFQWINGQYVPCYQSRRGERQVSYECCWVGSTPPLCPPAGTPAPPRPTGSCGRLGVMIQPFDPRTTVVPFTWTAWGPPCVASD